MKNLHCPLDPEITSLIWKKFNGFLDEVWDSFSAGCEETFTSEESVGLSYTRIEGVTFLKTLTIIGQLSNVPGDVWKFKISYEWKNIHKPADISEWELRIKKIYPGISYSGGYEAELSGLRDWTIMVAKLL